jgi:hypothetical protein
MLKKNVFTWKHGGGPTLATTHTHVMAGSKAKLWKRFIKKKSKDKNEIYP